jgi:hypothetical protein
MECVGVLFMVVFVFLAKSGTSNGCSISLVLGDVEVALLVPTVDPVELMLLLYKIWKSIIM